MRFRWSVPMITLVAAGLGLACDSPTSGGDTARPAGLIAFSREGSIYTVRPDGTQPHLLAQRRPPRRSGNLSFREPAWSPDGEHLAYVRTDGEDPGLETLVIARWDGSDARRFFPGEGTIFEIGWAPDGERLVFQRTLAEPSGLWLYTARKDGTELRLLPSPSSNAPILQCPSWSPGGDHLAFVNQYQAVWNARSDGNDARPLFTGAVVCVRWSPGGARLAFVNDKNHETSGVDPRFEIYLVNADGSGLTRLTDPPNSEGEAVWSPDGTRLAFAGIRDGTFGIYLMRQDNGGIERLTSDVANAQRLTWSPDGSQLAFLVGVPIMPDIYVINIDGSGLRNLTNTQAEGEYELDWR